jgi:hypothetical protein
MMIDFYGVNAGLVEVLTNNNVDASLHESYIQTHTAAEKTDGTSIKGIENYIRFVHLRCLSSGIIPIHTDSMAYVPLIPDNLVFPALRYLKGYYTLFSRKTQRLSYKK